MPISSKEDLEAELKKYEKKVTPAELKALRASLTKLVDGTGSKKEVMGITPQSEEALYALAYQFFNTGQYKKAWGCFWFLQSLEPLSYRYNFAIAACYQYMKQYEFASAVYLIASATDPENPVPYFHLYECFLQMGQPQDGLWSLKCAILRAENKPEFEPLLARAQMEYKKMRKEQPV